MDDEGGALGGNDLLQLGCTFQQQVRPRRARQADAQDGEVYCHQGCSRQPGPGPHQIQSEEDAAGGDEGEDDQPLHRRRQIHREQEETDDEDQWIVDEIGRIGCLCQPR